MNEADGEAGGGWVREGERVGRAGSVGGFGEGRWFEGGGGRGEGGRTTLPLIGNKEQNLDLFQPLWSRHTKEGSE